MYERTILTNRSEINRSSDDKSPLFVKIEQQGGKLLRAYISYKKQEKDEEKILRDKAIVGIYKDMGYTEGSVTIESAESLRELYTFLQAYYRKIR